MEYLMTAHQRVQPDFRRKKVGILGGTFNPPHSGHVDMAEHVRDEFALDEVYLMPCGTPPHKTEDLAPKQMRYQMTKLCAQQGKDVGVLDIEVKRKGYSFTSDTMCELAQKNPQADYYFIVGADTIFELCTWHNFEELLKLTRFICVRRERNDLMKLSAEIARLKWDYSAQIFLSEYTGLFVSSSYIRKRLKQGQSVAGLVPKNVEEYIIANGLYR